MAFVELIRCSSVRTVGKNWCEVSVTLRTWNTVHPHVVSSHLYSE